MSRVATYIEGGISGDITISSGTAAIGSGVIVNADVNASARLEFSKMENLTASRALVSDSNGDVSANNYLNRDRLCKRCNISNTNTVGCKVYKRFCHSYGNSLIIGEG